MSVGALTVQIDSSGRPRSQQMLLSFSLGSDSWTSRWEIWAVLEAEETMEATLCGAQTDFCGYDLAR